MADAVSYSSAVHSYKLPWLQGCSSVRVLVYIIDALGSIPNAEKESCSVVVACHSRTCHCSLKGLSRRNNMYELPTYTTLKNKMGIRSGVAAHALISMPGRLK